jgi:hypothetical protein
MSLWILCSRWQNEANYKVLSLGSVGIVLIAVAQIRHHFPELLKCGFESLVLGSYVAPRPDVFVSSCRLFCVRWRQDQNSCGTLQDKNINCLQGLTRRYSPGMAADPIN